MLWWLTKKINFWLSWLSGLLSAEIFICTCEWGFQMPPLTAENSHFLQSGSQGAALVMIAWWQDENRGRQFRRKGWISRGGGVGVCGVGVGGVFFFKRKMGGSRGQMGVGQGIKSELWVGGTPTHPQKRGGGGGGGGGGGEGEGVGRKNWVGVGRLNPSRPDRPATLSSSDSSS